MEATGPAVRAGTRILRRTLLGAALLLAAALVWGAVVEPRFVLAVEDIEARVPDLPPDWHGDRIAVFGDFGLGTWWDNDGALRRAVARAVQERPRAVLIAGNFLCPETGSRERDGAIRRAARRLAPLGDAGIPAYAVLGPHDYGVRSAGDRPDARLADRLVRALGAAGVVVLRNEAVLLDGSLFVVGVDPVRSVRGVPEPVLEALPPGAARVVLVHDPERFLDFEPGTAPFAVAGHTLGGQIRLPLLPRWTWLSRLWAGPRVWGAGWVDGRSGNHLYVNRGLGFSVVPLRFRAAPELTLVTLRRGGGTVPARLPDWDDPEMSVYMAENTRRAERGSSGAIVPVRIDNRRAPRAVDRALAGRLDSPRDGRDDVAASGPRARRVGRPPAR